MNRMGSEETCSPPKEGLQVKGRAIRMATYSWVCNRKIFKVSILLTANERPEEYF